MPDSQLAVLPLAVTMMAGPQIVSAVVLVTADRVVALSLAFLAGVAVAATAGVAVTTWLAGFLPPGPSSLSAGGSLTTVIQYALVALLLVIAIRAWVRREDSATPRWLGSLRTAGPGRAFRTGFLLIAFFPSDVVVLCTVGVSLARSGQGFTGAVPFLLATVLIAALPLLAYLVLRRRAEQVMPKVRDWLDGHGWLVNILACLLFIVLILS